MKRMRTGLIAVLTLMGLFVAVAVLGSVLWGDSEGRGDSATPQDGGALIFGAENEPTCLNPALATCATTWTDWTAGAALRGLYVQKPDFTFAPDLAARPAHVIANKPFTIRVKIRDEAVWSDGEPVSVEDVRFTQELHISPENEVRSRAGWQDIEKIFPRDAKTLDIVFGEPYGSWKQLLTEPIYPAHALRGADFNTVWNDALVNPHTGEPIGSGPFLLSEWDKGQSITMARNEQWWGKDRPHLDEVIFVFRADLNSQIQALRAGEVDAIYPQAQPQLTGLIEEPDVTTESNVGTRFEHIDFNLAASPLLGERWFRQAVAYAIDRHEIVNSVFKDYQIRIPVAQNLIYLSAQTEYERHFDVYRYDVDKVETIMEAHGCSEGDDGIWICNGERASVNIATTSGDATRGLVAEAIQGQAKEAGIDFRVLTRPANVLATDLVNRNYQSLLFAWLSTGDAVGTGGGLSIYGCDADSNYKAYCNARVTQLLETAGRTLGTATRAHIVNAADKLLAQDVPSLPLFQKPTFLAYKDYVHGLHDNPSVSGPTYNMQSWWVSRD
jgi:peptide/nickel transport system substrate-binding protein